MSTATDPDFGTIPYSARISQGFEHLASKLEQDSESSCIDFDVVIVGSGYGGAIAAAHLAGQSDSQGNPVSVCLLERGNEYLPGQFPARESDLAGHIRFSKKQAEQPSGRREGLFDIRMGDGINVVLSNGLGGGSLINAGVMEIPHKSAFDQGWPSDINNKEMEDYYNDAKELLGASHHNLNNTIKSHPELCQSPLQKYQALKSFSRNNLDKGKFRDAAITVGMKTGFNKEGMLVKKCTLCGDCATGCNHGAKESLDMNLLVKAERLGAAIYTGATVLTIEPSLTFSGWEIDVTYTSETLRQRQGNYRKLRTTRVILAAGTLGSTEILQRSENAKKLDFSKALGSKFSGNGDAIFTGYNHKITANAVATESEKPDQRRVGPTITGIIDLRNNDKDRFVIEEMAVPGPLRRIFEEINTTAKTLNDLDCFDWSNHQAGQPQNDHFAVNPKAISHSSIYAVMARDNALGELSLPELKEGQHAAEGTIHINGSKLREDPVYVGQFKKLQDMLKRSRVGGHIIANPLWRLLPEAMANLLDIPPGPVISVHPLGGCPMGASAQTGVVDQYGRVFDPSPSNSKFYEGLLVLDGSIIPCALGTNPALTIASLSLRAISRLPAISSTWDFKDRPSTPASRQRQRSASKDHTSPKPSVATEVELIERLSGEIKLQNKNGTLEDYIVELTLCFDHKKIRQLTHFTEEGNPDKRFFTIPASSTDKLRPSTLHIYTREVWRQLQASNATQRLARSAWDAQAELVLPIHGSLELFSRQSSFSVIRTVKALYAYLLNRGIRDIYQQIGQPNKKYLSRLLLAFKLASRAGETRLLKYQLKLTEQAEANPNTRLETSNFKAGHMISGIKRLKYHRRANPWQQLMTVKILKFPGYSRQPGSLLDKILTALHLNSPGQQNILTLDTNYLVGNGIPLLRIAKQQDEPAALFELVSFGAYAIRMLISTHIWTFRKPDKPKTRSRHRLPGKIKGPATFKEHPIVIDKLAGKNVNIRLTQYPQEQEQQKNPPVLLIHGYSASGSTYTHPAIKPNLAEMLYRDGREVWVLDLRSSIGWDGSNGLLKTADMAWTFEDIAFTDIPFAIDYIVNETQCGKIDIVAHCIGAAMISMAILSEGAVDADQTYRKSLGGGKRKAYPEALAALPSRINRLVLSQVGPLIIFSPANVMRAYVMSFMRHYMPSEKYSFNPELDPTGNEASKLTGELLDRLLYSLPYPDDEYDIENPLRPCALTGFTGTRHRMDALYGRTFSLKNFPEELLNHIDDIFGPLNITTLSQVIQLAKHQTLSNYLGNNEFVSRKKLRKHWTFPSLHIHGDENGLADPKTLLRMDYYLKAAGIKLETRLMKGLGHQDSLMGKKAHVSFEHILHFLNKPIPPYKIEEAQKITRFVAMPPWSGPIIGSPEDGEIPIRLGAEPGLNDPILVSFLPVKRCKDHLAVIHNGQISDQESLLTLIKNSVKLIELADDNDRWHKLKAPWPLESEPLADGILTLFIYEDFSNLTNSSFENSSTDSNIAGINTRTSHFLSTEDTTSPQDHLHALAKVLSSRSASYLEKGLIEYRRNECTHRLNFAFASCQYPAGILYKQLAYQSWRRLSLKLDGRQAELDLLLLLGDQIYSDPTAGLFDPKSKEDLFEHPYQQWLHHSDVRSVLRRLPTYMMLDDHEICDNWVKGSPEPENSWRFELGVKSYIRYQRQESLSPGQPLWLNFENNGFPFFMTDTRSCRELRNASDIADKNIIDEQQFSALESWIKDNQNNASKPMFISSSAILLPRHLLSISDQCSGAIRSDSWDGYPASLHRLLAFLADEQVNNAIFLSGDEHMAVITRIDIRNQDTGHKAVTHSIHSSSLHAPFPFANGQPEQLKEEDRFNFQYKNAGSQSHNHYECTVSTQLVMTGDGFSLVRVSKQYQQWQVECAFDREPAPNSTNIPVRILL